MLGEISGCVAPVTGGHDVGRRGITIVLGYSVRVLQPLYQLTSHSSFREAVIIYQF